MPDLIVIAGPPASGKAAIGHALAELTGFRLFHNHLTADAAAALFGWGTPLYLESTAEMRLTLLKRALSEPDSPNIIFTFVWAFDLAEDRRFMAELAALFTDRGHRVFYVELLASLQTRLLREGTAFRVERKPAKRDVHAARKVLLDFEGRFRMNSSGDFPVPELHLLVDTEQQDPVASAELICRRFGFRRTSGTTPAASS